jgi:hypothetical protein
MIFCCFLPLDVKENDGHALDFTLRLSRPFRSRRVWTFPLGAHTFFPGRLSNYYQGLHHTFSKIFTKFYAHSLFLCGIHHEIA